jgi:FMN phosphatase YigB (HAD superfamily)
MFIDDTAAIVVAARGLGMTAVQYQRPEDLRAALGRYL